MRALQHSSSVPSRLRRASGRRPLGRDAGCRRGAVFSVELLLILPLLTAIFFGLVEVSQILSARQQIAVASRVACRVGTLPASSPADLEQAVRCAAKRALADSALAASFRMAFVPGEHSGDPVSVTICVPMKAASPNLLASLGFTLEGRSLSVTTVMRKE